MKETGRLERSVFHREKYARDENMFRVDRRKVVNKIKELFQKYREVIMYLIFGVATTLVNFIVTFGLQRLFKLTQIANEYGKSSSKYQVLYLTANIIAWFVAVLFAFFTNKKYVFESRTVGAKAYFSEMGKFFGARAASGVVENALPSLLVKIGLDQSVSVVIASKTYTYESFWAKAITAVIVIILNYVFSKLFVFRKKKDAGDAAEEGDAKASEEAGAENETLAEKDVKEGGADE